MSKKYTEVVQSVNLDANESAIFARELEAVKRRSYDVKYPEYKATRLIPVSTEAGPAAESITYQQFDSVGIMKIIASYASDLPRADITGKEFNSPVRSLGVSYGYNIQEIRASALVGRPLQQRKANAARRAYDQAVNRIGWLARTGDGVNGGLQGLIYNPNITVATAHTGATTSAVTWALKNNAEIVKDVNDSITAIISNSQGVETPNTVLLPIAQFRLIATRRMADGTDTTILSYLKVNNPMITTWDWINEADAVTPKPSDLTDTSGSDIMIVYRRDPDTCTLELPQMYEQFPAQERNLEFVIPAHARIGGVLIYYPLAFRIIEGI